MADSNLTHAKVVASPNEYSWSQAYNAGKLFAVLSLETQEELTEKDYLNVLGKEILDNLEQEFFTLEKKDLESIKEAVEVTSKKIPDDISCSFVIGAFTNNVLYVYILGDGKVTLKRGETIGNLIESLDQTSKDIKVASGFLEDNDTVILQTKQFAKIVSGEKLSEFLDNLNPADASENLAPFVHEKEEPGAATIIVNYKAPVEAIEKAVESPKEEISEKEEPEAAEIEESPFYTPKFSNDKSFFDSVKPFFLSIFSKVRLPKGTSLNHPRKVILSIVIIVLIVFVVSVAFAYKNQQDAKVKEAFAQIYPAAEKKYEEGQGLSDLNRNLAKDSFLQAKDILESGKDKLPKDSKEQKQVLDLLSKVNSALGPSTTPTNSEAKQVDLSKSAVLSVESKNTAISFSYDDKNIYMLTEAGVYSFDLDGASKKQIIKNDNIWEDGASVFPYSGYIYVLDKKGQIIKFVETDSGYTNGNYFSSDQDFSKAVSLAIDNNIYVLASNGNVDKFFKGSPADFSLKGLDKDLSSPIKIYTNPDIDNIYVLDKGNGRIVVFDKKGSYVAEYNASIIKSAKDFEVLEKDNLIYVLSSGKLYEIPLK